jgi:Uma2 family endonuclease
MAVEETVAETTTAKQRLFTVDEYHRMIETAILHEDDRVELINGIIVEMPAVGSRHAACLKRLLNLLPYLKPQDVIIDAQNPVQLDERSEPQPDVALLRHRADFYAGSHPRPEDILLVIEISDTSLATDRADKIPLYARSGFAEAWIVDISHRRVEVYSKPVEGRFTSIRAYEQNETVESPTLDWLKVAVISIVE